MKFQIDEKYLIDSLERIMNVPSPVGYYTKLKPVLEAMAKELGYHYRYLSTVVNRCFGAGFSEVVNRYRVDLACRLLRQTDESITEIASRVGYDSQRNFNRSFKAVTGKTPREYRRERG